MALVLGTIVFADWEVPDQISFGGKHEIVRRRMIGGATVIDAMGPNDTDISWDGTFLGPMSELRARRVDFLRRSGRKVILSWASFIYEVVVIGFRGDYRRTSYIPYHIELAVVRDVVSEQLGPAVERIEDGMRRSLEEAFGATGGDPFLTGVVTGVQTTVMQVLTGGKPTLAGLGVAAAAGLQAGLASGFTAASTAAGSADATLGSADAIKAGKDPAQMATAFEAQNVAAQSSYHAHSTASHLGVAQAQAAIPLPPPPAPSLTQGTMQMPLIPPPPVPPPVPIV